MYTSVRTTVVPFQNWMYFTYKKVFTNRTVLTCYRLNNVCTLHTLDFCNTFRALIHKKKKKIYVFQHRWLTQFHMHPQGNKNKQST